MQNGFEVEESLVNGLNKKKVSDLKPYFQGLVRECFPDIGGDEIISANLANRFSKPDITIWRGKEPCYISVKSDYVHTEKTSWLIKVTEGRRC